MFNEAHISLSGYVATQPFSGETRTGVPSVRMRVAWTPRRLDRVTGEWVDGNTSFLTVHCYRKLAENIGTCLRKGDPVVVRGRLSIREYEDKNGAQRTSVEVDASSVGHDLSHGVAQFQRVRPQTGMTAVEHRAAEDPAFAVRAGMQAGPGGMTGESGLEGTGDLDGVAGPAGAGGPGGSVAQDDAFASLAEGGDGEMFDEEAVGVLAEEAATAGTPF
jgi:single-strand DNA-binding protein